MLNLRNILLLGVAIRLFFFFIGAKIYYGTADFALNGGDTWSWVECMQNLVHHGTYTIDLNYPDGKFYRPPGYAFFMMIFYFLCGLNLGLAFKVMSFAQVLLDIATLTVVYKTVRNHSQTEEPALIASLLYAVYPFSLVWTPVLYAESPSLFFMFTGLYLISKREAQPMHQAIAGFALGFMVLMRVQTIFLIPAIAVMLILQSSGNIVKAFKPYVLFFLTFGIVYGAWPLRNLIHGKFIPAVIETNHRHFSEDYVAFMHYIWSVQVDHRPQYDQIISGQQVIWPRASYLQPGDSTILAETALLCNTCGRGFSYFKASAGLIPEPITELNECSKRIALTFNRLTAEQKRNNAWHYYVTIPLQKLKKVIFKSQLYDAESTTKRWISTALFGFRTLMIVLGLVGIAMNSKYKTLNPAFLSAILIFTLTWYFALCVIYRNIEIRYLLPVDTLLLIPAAIPITALLNKINLIKQAKS